MPLKNVRYRVRTTPSGAKVRLAFRGKKKVVEAKSLSSGRTHTPREFVRDRAKSRSISRRRS